MTSTLALYAITAALLAQQPAPAGRAGDDSSAPAPGSSAPAPGDVDPVAPPDDPAYGTGSSGDARVQGRRPSPSHEAPPPGDNNAIPAPGDDRSRADDDRWSEDQGEFQRRSWTGP